MAIDQPSRDDLMHERSPVPGISRNVWWLGLTSFFTDISSEMLYPLVPIFVTVTLGAPAVAVGVIEGAAEATASFLRLFSGWLSDRLGRRRGIVIAGYALSAAAKPLLAAAGSWPVVLAARVADRVGKGVRTSARDALLADSASPETRGRAFGFHRSADTMGAVLGPLLSIPLLAAAHNQIRPLFLLSIVPAGCGLAALFLVRDRPAAARHVSLPRLSYTALDAPFRRYLVVLLIFALGNSSDAFIILRGRQLGLSLTGVILAYAAYNFVYSLSAYPAGILSDRIGRRPMVVAGFAFFAAVYLGFAAAGAPWQFWSLLAVYGLYMGLTDGLTRAMAADLSAPEVRGTALGWVQMVSGAGALAASLVAGALWTEVGPAAPFAYGATLAALAAACLAFWTVGPAAGPQPAGPRSSTISGG
ncbi:MAG TPA: MFS transporter [bacterium]|nr:MFS transporter [bacterium]